ncbi:MAG: hypothetical protein HQ582_26145, partial [Planctomycetes bacterium]|nr:hypothetical protein [Planctomycetota bacterium]
MPRPTLPILVLFVACGLALAEDPVDVGSRRELFVDDALIQSLTGGAELRLHHP